MGCPRPALLDANAKGRDGDTLISYKVLLREGSSLKSSKVEGNMGYGIRVDICWRHPPSAT